MNNTVLKTSSALALCLFGLSALANDIEPTKEFLNVFRSPAPIVMDGDLSEWAGVPALVDPKFAIPKGSGALGNYVAFEEYAGGTWTGPADQSSAMQVVYDADNVYLGFVVTDDYHDNAYYNPWNGDSVQLMIASADRTLQVALYNFALGGIETELGYTIGQVEAGPGGIEATVTRNTTTKRTTYEIKLTKESLGLANLADGTQFGLGVAINDGDEQKPGQGGWGGLGAHSIVFGKTPSETALITLVNPAEEINDLIGAVNFLSIHAGTKNALVVKLNAALAALSVNNKATACATLQAFINLCRAQKNKTIPGATADALIAEATSIRTVIGCP